MTVKLRIGTRGSPLALTQTEMVRAALAWAHPGLETEAVVIRTSGDWKPEDGEAPLSAADGGKGLFAKEIEEQLLAGEIDAAVHSMKDMDSHLPEGLIIAHMLPREDPRDVFILSDLAKNSQKEIKGFDGFKQGAVVATSSVRRQAFLLAHRPDIKIVPMRGNVQTRIDKLRAGHADATLLAYAGLKRLELAHEADIILEPEEMLPSAGQGAVGIEIREDNKDILAIFSQISCSKTVLCVAAERAALGVLDGSCRTPVGAYAVLENEGIYLRVKVAMLDGTESWSEEARGAVSTVEEAQALGVRIGNILKPQIPPGLVG